MARYRDSTVQESLRKLKDPHINDQSVYEAYGFAHGVVTSAMSVSERLARRKAEKAYRETLETSNQVVKYSDTELISPKPWVEPESKKVTEGRTGPTHKPARSNIFLVNLETEERVKLPWIPQTISMDPSSKLVAMPSIGRNTPFYHYTGSEDTLEFIIDWFFTDDISRKAAIHNATKIEAFSKSNGYETAPPRIKIVWGGSNIFKNSIWLLEQAPYRLSNWVDHVWNKELKELTSYKLLPQQINQEVKFKRVSKHNLSTEDIVFEI